MIPTPIITFLGTKLISGILSVISANSRAKNEAHKMAMEKAIRISKDRKELNDNRNTHFQWTRRYLAVSMWTMYILIKLAVLFGISAVPVVVGQTEIVSHGFWIFTWTSEAFKWVTVPGVPLTSFDYHLMAAICGSYFGSSITHNS